VIVVVVVVVVVVRVVNIIIMSLSLSLSLSLTMLVETTMMMIGSRGQRGSVSPVFTCMQHQVPLTPLSCDVTRHRT
jgi:hypothetical protein